MRVGFIGLGQMGAGMAANLLAAGHDVTVYNRTPSKSEALRGRGAKVAQRPRDACAGDAVITMLADDTALEAAVYGADGVLAGLARGAMHVSSSTISIALSRRLAKDHAAAGQRFLAAPVFGRPEAAAAAKLFVVAGGAADAVRDAGPLFDATAQKVFTVSAVPADANLVKLSGNFLIAAVIESLGEVMALAGKAGVDKHQLLEVLTSTLFGAPVYKTYGNLIADAKFEPAGFAAPLGLKDVKLALAAGEDLGVPLPIASLLRDRFVSLLANGGEALDWSAMGALAAKDAGSR